MHRRTAQALHTLIIFGLLIVSLGLGPVSPAAAQAGDNCRRSFVNFTGF